ncbi:MAG: GNAT family N-acyltransferase [Rhizobiaceae bacterium]
MAALLKKFPFNETAESVSGNLGKLSVRLANSNMEIRKLQALRYEVFYNEMSAVPSIGQRFTKLDKDEFDGICDHLLVLEDKRNIAGTYRLLRQEIAEKNKGFYTAREFDIALLLERHKSKKFLELGRSCVRPEFRTKRTIELLWHGTWSYFLQHNCDVMFGCASFSVTDPKKIEQELSYLHHNFRAGDEWQIRAFPGLPSEKIIDMDRVPAEQLDPRAVLRTLPPLIKGYLRVGAMVGSQAVLDEHFGTIDVLIILPVENIAPRYLNYYGIDASRHKSAGDMSAQD